MGEKIAELRRAKKLSQAELARRSGVSRTMVYMLESGRRQQTTLGTLRKLAAVLEVEVAELIV